MSDPATTTLSSPYNTFGISGVTLVSRDKGWVAGVGLTWVYTYQCVASQADTFFASLTSANDNTFDSVQQSINNGMATIVCTVAQDVSTTTTQDVETSLTWDLTPIEITHPLETALQYADLGQAMTDRVKSLYFNKALYHDKSKGNALYNIDVNTFKTSKDSNGIPTEVQQSLAKQLYNSYCTGFQEYTEYSFTIKKSIIVSSGNTSVKCAWENVGKAVNYNDIGITGSYRSAFLGTLSNKPDFDASKKQFLCKAPSLMSVGKNKFQITQEWLWASQWDKLVYNGDYDRSTKNNYAPTDFTTA